MDIMMSEFGGDGRQDEAGRRGLADVDDLVDGFGVTDADAQEVHAARNRASTAARAIPLKLVRAAGLLPINQRVDSAPKQVVHANRHRVGLGENVAQGRLLAERIGSRRLNGNLRDALRSGSLHKGIGSNEKRP